MPFTTGLPILLHHALDMSGPFINSAGVDTCCFPRFMRRLPIQYPLFHLILSFEEPTLEVHSRNSDGYIAVDCNVEFGLQIRGRLAFKD